MRAAALKGSCAVLCAVVTASCESSSSRVIDGITVTVAKVERVRAINEAHAQIRTEAGQEFVKVVLAAEGKGRPPKEMVAAVENWKLAIIDQAGKERGPAFGWRFVDEDARQVRVYSNPVPIGTQFTVIRIEGQPLSLKGS